MMKWDTLHEKSKWLYRKMTGQPVTPGTDEALERIVGKARENGYIARKIREQQQYDYLRAYNRLLHPRKKMAFVLARRIAAAVVLVLAAGTILYFVQRPAGEAENNRFAAADIIPGQYKAFLIKNNGEQVCLKADIGIISETDGTLIWVDSSGLSYGMADTVKSDEVLFNTLVVPRGGEYNLLLADGSKVWLNADSRLKYPIAFTGKTREVFVSGEAYFEVKKQEGKPFIVKTSRGDITVLGTQFNVSDYPESEQLVTTLVTGKIAFGSASGKSIILTPSQQLMVDKDGTCDIKTVDTRYATSWKDGLFLFEDRRLEDILLQLSRWYDIHVIYLNEEVKDLHFSGDLSRFRDIGIFIGMFEESSKVRCKLDGRTLIIGF